MGGFPKVFEINRFGLRNTEWIWALNQIHGIKTDERGKGYLAEYPNPPIEKEGEIMYSSTLQL